MSKKIKIGEYYRHRTSSAHGWAKVINIIPAKTGINTNSYKIAECEWTIDKNDSFGFIKYFRLSDLTNTTREV